MLSHLGHQAIEFHSRTGPSPLDRALVFAARLNLVGRRSSDLESEVRLTCMALGLPGFAVGLYGRA